MIEEVLSAVNWSWAPACCLAPGTGQMPHVSGRMNHLTTTATECCFGASISLVSCILTAHPSSFHAPPPCLLALQYPQPFQTFGFLCVLYDQTCSWHGMTTSRQDRQYGLVIFFLTGSLG